MEKNMETEEYGSMDTQRMGVAIFLEILGFRV